MLILGLAIIALHCCIFCIRIERPLFMSSLQNAVLIKLFKNIASSLEDKRCTSLSVFCGTLKSSKIFSTISFIHLCTSVRSLSSIGINVCKNDNIISGVCKSLYNF
ncbi:hypothetical protein MRV_0048 [Murid herpesvirus 3]|uniref:Uncharacterized protein n=2 Tax=Murid betaherpesvirus 3 TaxID=2560603 RepID=A0A1P8VIS9_9BETA|nr:hypothetical protein MRV_0048 [Murine roseolovirus]APZ76259.1 hypothetical protein MRV_0048 [Murid betaherpesvirus 3]AYH64818.1 hypothetical protein MRV_0048 [Murid herpesvirus 3]